MRRIQRARKDRADQLDLSNLGLGQLPAALSELDHLKELRLGGNRLPVLPEAIRHLVRLETLSLGGNHLTYLPQWFSELRTLRDLRLGGNALVVLPENFGRLSALRILHAGGNRLATLPASLRHLTALHQLDVSDNRLNVVPPCVRDLTGLTDLRLAQNNLRVAPNWLGELTALTRLDLSGNGLDSLPEELGDLPGLIRLDLDGNYELISPPPEIVTDGTSAVLGFLRALARGAVAQWSSKLLLVGEAAVGKTSVANLLCGLSYDPNEPQTHGVHVNTLGLSHPGDPATGMELSVWDFGGQLEYRATQRFYLTDRSLFLLVWNSRRGWRSGGQIEAWLETITHAAPHSPIIIVATHCNESVDDLDVIDLRRRFRSIAATLRVDCKDATGIEQLRAEIARHAATLPLMGERWPAAWADGTAALAQLPGTHTTRALVRQQLREGGIDPSDHDTVLAALHDRGQILHFARDPLLCDLVVLRPTWIDAMITRVLDSQTVADRGGLLSRAHRAELWHDLDAGLADLLITMMERFDLAYRIDSPDHEETALVVERLPAGMPERLAPGWDDILATPGASELRLTYKLPSRQPGIPSWFIAREHRFTTATAWARGVLLRHRGAALDAWALLVDDNQAQPTLQLTVRGIAPYVFYSILDEAFTRIVTERYPGLKLKRLIPCPCAPPRQPPCTQQFDHATAQRALNTGHLLQCQQTFTMVDPRALLLGLHPPAQEVVLSRLDDKLDGIARTTSRIHDTQLYLLDLVRDLLRSRAENGTHCPGIFTFTPIHRGRTGDRIHAPVTQYQLRLYCEQPDSPHPLPDGFGCYTLTKIPGWLGAYAPYLRILLAGLKHALPLIGPAINGILGQTLAESTSAQLELTCDLLDQIHPLESATSTVSELLSGVTADFAGLRRALLAIDSDFGGLRERELPENRGIAYLCAAHRQVLHYPSTG